MHGPFGQHACIYQCVHGHILLCMVMTVSIQVSLSAWSAGPAWSVCRYAHRLFRRSSSAKSSDWASLGKHQVLLVSLAMLASLVGAFSAQQLPQHRVANICHAGQFGQAPRPAQAPIATEIGQPGHPVQGTQTSFSSLGMFCPFWLACQWHSGGSRCSQASQASEDVV